MRSATRTRALEFYTKKLGVQGDHRQPFDGTQRWIELGLPRADTKLVLFTAPGHEHMIGKLQNVTFVADDVDATARELKARGVEFIREPEKADWGTSAFFKDQDGNHFVLSTPYGARTCSQRFAGDTRHHRRRYPKSA